MRSKKRLNGICSFFLATGMAFLLVSILVNAESSENLVSTSKVDKETLQALKENEVVEVVVVYENQLVRSNAIRSNQQRKILSEESLHITMIDSLSEHTNSILLRVDKEGLESLTNDPLVKRVLYDKKYSVFLKESSEIVFPKNLNQLGLTGNGISVCVIDTGVDYTHQSLGGCSHAEFIEGNCAKVVDGYDFYDNDNDPMDENGHGTHVAGIVASEDTTYKGIASEAKIVAMRVCDKTGKKCSISAINNAIEWCTDNSEKHNIKIITMSLGGGKHSDFCKGDTNEGDVKNARKKGIIVTAASGNEEYTNGIGSPACIEEAISIGATSKKDKVADYSNRNKVLDLLAPGGEWGKASDTAPFDEIVSLYSRNVSNDPTLCAIENKQGKCLDNDYVVSGDYLRSPGTSMAAPHVAGAAALLQEAYNSKLTPDQIEFALKRGGKSIWDPKVKTGLFSNGMHFPRLDIAKSLEVLQYKDIDHEDWPTENHDYRRTGFTLLQGDMDDDENMHNTFTFFLNEDDGAEHVVKPSVTDLDDDENMDVVALVHKTTFNDFTMMYGTEMSKQFKFIGYTIPKKAFNPYKIVGGAIFFPPTLEDIDDDGEKEIVTGTRDGRIYAFDVNGKNVQQKWMRQLEKRFDPILNQNEVRFNGGNAVVDIDLDGNMEVIAADVGAGIFSTSWPGNVYVINAETGSIESEYTVSNGGAYASVSVANIDGDDQPEVMVPTFYGVKVLDYNPSTKQFSEKCSTSHGLLEGSAVIDDVDKDNEYELVYATSNYNCAAGKLCRDKVYVVDAATCTTERHTDIDGIARPTVTVANLDTDSQKEIIVSALDELDLSKGPVTPGSIIAFDSKTMATHGTYDASGKLHPGFVSPNIADINGDGEYNIILGENEGSTVYVLDNDLDEQYQYDVEGFMDNGLAIADVDNDQKAEIVFKRGSSPQTVLVGVSAINDQPELESIKSMRVKVGETIDLSNPTASDPNGDALTFIYSAPLGEDGTWTPTKNDTGEYSILVQASDGSLVDTKRVDVHVLSEDASRIATFADGTSTKEITFSGAQTKTLTLRVPKNMNVEHAQLVLKPDE